MEHYFDVILTSVDVGYDKPDKKIFLRALKALKVQPEEAVMVGNRISTDIVGANRIGMKTVLFKWNKRYPEEAGSPSERPKQIISSLKELLSVLSKCKKEKQRINVYFPRALSGHGGQTPFVAHRPSRTLSLEVCLAHVCARTWLYQRSNQSYRSVLVRKDLHGKLKALAAFNELRVQDLASEILEKALQDEDSIKMIIKRLKI